MSIDHNRIALYLPMLSGGGAERVFLTLAKAFLEQGLQVDLVLATRRGELIEQVPQGVTVVDLRAKGVFDSLPGLIRYLRQKQPFALLSTLSHANIIAIWAKYLAFTQTRVVVRLTTTLSVAAKRSSRLFDRIMPILTRLFYPFAHKVIVSSIGMGDDLQITAGIQPQHIATIPNPLDIQAIQLQMQQDIPTKIETQPLVLAAGRLTRDKDFETLLQAISIVRHARPIRLIILGEGPARQQLEHLRLALDLSKDVEFPGFVQNPYAYLQHSSCFVLSSVREGYPNVLLEALACGCPIVSTDCPSGPSEILAGGRYGRLVPIGDVEALAEAILATLAEPPSADLLKTRAQEFDHRVIAARYLAVLRGEDATNVS